MSDEGFVIKYRRLPLQGDDEPGIPVQPREVDRHFALLAQVMGSYPERSQSPEHMASFLDAARDHLAEFATLAPALRAWFHGCLPSVPTFKLLAIALEEQGEFSEGIAVCEAAQGLGLDDGTKGGFAGRMERLRRKAARVDTRPRGCSTPSVARVHRQGRASMKFPKSEELGSAKDQEGRAYSLSFFGENEGAAAVNGPRQSGVMQMQELPEVHREDAKDAVEARAKLAEWCRGRGWAVEWASSR